MPCKTVTLEGHGHTASSTYYEDAAAAVADAEAIARNSAINEAGRKWKAYDCGQGCRKPDFDDKNVKITFTSTSSRFSIRALWGAIWSFFQWNYTASCDYTWSYLLVCIAVLPPTQPPE